MIGTNTDYCPLCKGQQLTHHLAYTDDISGQTFDILRCEKCGLLLTQNPPHISAMQPYFNDSDATCYQPAKSMVQKWIQHLRDVWNKEQVKIVCQESQRNSGVLLEIGSKQGYFANAMRNSGWITHSVERDTTAREYGNKRFLLQTDDIRKMFEIKARSYNVVVAWDTLGEAVDMHHTLDKLSQLIVSDGTLIIAFDNAACDNASLYGADWNGWNAPRKRFHLTPTTFETLVKQHNMEIVNIRHSSHYDFMTTVMSRCHKQGNSNILLLWWQVFKEKLTAPGKHNYYIYTLKHQQ